MKKQDYQNLIQVATTAGEVFKAITQRIPEWWSKDFKGIAQNSGDEFTVRFDSTFKTMKIGDVVKDKKVEWVCVDQYMEVPKGMEPLKNKSEWVGTKILWEIDINQAGTRLKHTHIGLTPEVECWAICEPGWDQTLQSLSLLLLTGQGKPFKQLDDEHLLKALHFQAKSI